MAVSGHRKKPLFSKARLFGELCNRHSPVGPTLTKPLQVGDNYSYAYNRGAKEQDAKSFSFWVFFLKIFLFRIKEIKNSTGEDFVLGLGDKIKVESGK